MTLYEKVIAQEGRERLVLSLTQLGCATKPYYLCQVRHERPGTHTPPIVLFLEALDGPTIAVDAVVDLVHGLTAFAPDKTLLEIASIAQSWAGKPWGRLS